MKGAICLQRADPSRDPLGASNARVDFLSGGNSTMEIEQRIEGSVTIVSPHQKLDTGTAPMAGQTFSDLMNHGAQRIVVDFSDVPYITSAGLRVLLATAKQLRAKGGELRVCALNEAVQEVFEISGFNTLLPVFASPADAVREF